MSRFFVSIGSGTIASAWPRIADFSVSISMGGLQTADRATADEGLETEAAFSDVLVSIDAAATRGEPSS